MQNTENTQNTPIQTLDPTQHTSPHAPRWKRLLAVILDTLILYGPLFLLISPAALTNTPPPPEHNQIYGILIVIMLLGTVTLQCILLTLRGQTLGKIALNIRITTLEGQNPGFLRAVLLRNLDALLSLIPGIGTFLCIIGLLLIFAPDRRCLHDHIAGTRVIQLPPKKSSPQTPNRFKNDNSRLQSQNLPSTTHSPPTS